MRTDSDDLSICDILQLDSLVSHCNAGKPRCSPWGAQRGERMTPGDGIHFQPGLWMAQYGSEEECRSALNQAR
jgi:hypothetical protein